MTSVKRIVYPTDRYWCDDGCGWHYDAICPDCGKSISALFTGLARHKDVNATEDCKDFILVDPKGDDEDDLL